MMHRPIDFSQPSPWKLRLSGAGRVFSSSARQTRMASCSSSREMVPTSPSLSAFDMTNSTSAPLGLTKSFSRCGVKCTRTRIISVASISPEWSVSKWSKSASSLAANARETLCPAAPRTTGRARSGPSEPWSGSPSAYLPFGFCGAQGCLPPFGARLLCSSKYSSCALCSFSSRGRWSLCSSPWRTRTVRCCAREDETRPPQSGRSCRRTAATPTADATECASGISFTAPS
mmetsp:Transcript_30222/g.101890  ORF Transcript_30222/g.101890 Transcript_30222/m.101890 type:complete len:231 (-) Transcript_30222:99-791(-)